MCCRCREEQNIISVCKLKSIIRYHVNVGFPGGSAGKESTCNAGDLSQIPRLRRSPGEGKGYPLEYSGLENSMDCIVHGVAQSDMTEATWQQQKSDFHFTSLHVSLYILVRWERQLMPWGVAGNMPEQQRVYFRRLRKQDKAVRENIGCPVKLEFLINSKQFSGISGLFGI